MRCGAYQMNSHVVWYNATGTKLVNDPNSVTVAEKEQFLMVGAGLKKFSLGLNMILGNVTLDGAAGEIWTPPLDCPPVE